MILNNNPLGAVVVFGGGGQVGSELGQIKIDSLVTLNSSDCNITESSQISSVLDRLSPQLVINCAAYTAVDRAETDTSAAYLVNAKGPELIAQACVARGIGLIHLSTDYVFAGDGDTSLTESCSTNPLSVYGASKLQGEEAVRAIMGNLGITVRTSAVFGQKGPNFVLTMLKLFSSRPTINVVNDQWMSPTWTGWLAPTLLKIGEHFTKFHTFPVSIVHACCSGQINWYDFSRHILKQSGITLQEPKSSISDLVEANIPRAKMSENDVLQATASDISDNRCDIKPINAMQFNAAAKRPNFSVLDTALLQREFGIVPMSWQDGVNCYLASLGYCTGESREHSHLSSSAAIR